MKIHFFASIGTLICLAVPVFLQEKFNIADSINQFSFDLLASVNQEAGDNLNVILSPLTIWTLLTVVAEGSRDKTADELNRALGLPQDKTLVRDSYERLATLSQTKSKETEYETSTGIFSKAEFPLKKNYASVVRQYYDTSITPVNFNNSKRAADVINNYVARATRNRIPILIDPSELENAHLFMTSTMFFKGQWQTPFNATATQIAAFLNDQRNRIGEVQMMYQAHPFPYSRIDKIKADVLELPYGFDDTFSMVVMVPRGAQTVTNMLNALRRESMTDIMAKLKRNHALFSEDDVHVYFPKFKTSSNFNMDVALERLGIREVFNPQRANLLGMYNHYLYLSRLIQKAEIEVNEEGTVASAAAGAIFVNRAPPPMVKANRPFAFFIINKKTGSIILAGKISNPNTLRQ